MRSNLSRFLAVCVLGAACSGRIGGGGRGPGAAAGTNGGAAGSAAGGSAAGSAAGGSAGTAIGAAGAGGAGALAPAGMRRLTPTEYWSSVSGLLALDASTPVPVTEDVAAISGFKNVAASTLTISAEGVSEYADAAQSVSALVFGDETKRTALVGCSPAAASDPCVRAFLTTFGRRAWRRPLTAAEVDRYAGIVTSLAPMADVWTGLQYAVAGLLQSPWFLYRVEVGEPDPTRAHPLRYSAYEMAERLSYFLWDTTPDDALLDAAASGDTLAPGGLDAQLSRLLASPRAQAGVARFFREYLSTDDLATMTKDATLFPRATPTLAAAMAAEVEATTADLVFTRRADLRDLLDNRQTFVNAELATLYGLPGVTGTALVPATLPDSGPRAGLLGTAAFLALNARTDRTSPTLRGKFVREQLLCEPVSPPPANFAATFDAPGTAKAGTLRQRLVQHMSDAACSSCHALMDPLGFAFEHFDAQGAYRANEGGLPIDDTGTVDGTAFTGPRALATALRAMPAVTGCLARQIYRYGTGHLETDGEAAVLADVGGRAQAAGNAYVDYLRAIAESDGFRFAGGLR